MAVLKVNICIAFISYDLSLIFSCLMLLTYGRYVLGGVCVCIYSSEGERERMLRTEYHKESIIPSASQDNL